MSIMITGMEMPDNCMECPLETDYGTCGYYSLYVEAGHESDCEKRRDDCPLVSVPKHWRLIDADALVKKQPIPELGAPRWLIEQAPTIIPAEESE